MDTPDGKQNIILINESGLYSLIDDEDKLTRQIVVSGQNRNVTIINESGLYSLIQSQIGIELGQRGGWLFEF